MRPWLYFRLSSFGPSRPQTVPSLSKLWIPVSQSLVRINSAFEEVRAQKPITRPDRQGTSSSHFHFLHHQKFCPDICLPFPTGLPHRAGSPNNEDYMCQLVEGRQLTKMEGLGVMHHLSNACIMLTSNLITVFSLRSICRQEHMACFAGLRVRGIRPHLNQLGGSLDCARVRLVHLHLRLVLHCQSCVVYDQRRYCGGSHFFVL